jgi:hypothetical protein
MIVLETSKTTKETREVQVAVGQEKETSGCENMRRR